MVSTLSTGAGASVSGLPVADNSYPSDGVSPTLGQATWIPRAPSILPLDQSNRRVNEAKSARTYSQSELVLANSSPLNRLDSSSFGASIGLGGVDA